MAYTLGAMLIASLAAANVLFLYDLNVTGPAWGRVVVTAVPAGLALAGLDANHPWPRTTVLVFASVTLALGWVSVLQLLVVRRDAIIMSAALGRRR